MNEVKDPQKALERRIKRHITSQQHTFFAVIQPGFEETARKELQDLGIHTILEKTEGGLEFQGTLKDCYTVNISSRTVTRFIMRIGSFKTSDFDHFKKKLIAIPWELHIKTGTTIDASITAHHSRLYHTGRLEEELNAAIKERLDSYDIQLSHKNDNPTQKIFIRIDNNRCTISLDTSGAPLYKRGRKHHITSASLRETTAAVILLESRFNEYNIILDPMCGSGTFGIEALEMSMSLLSGRDRKFTFMQWPAFREQNYLHLVKSLTPEELTIPKGKVFMSDIDPESVSAASENLQSFGIPDIRLPIVHDFFSGPMPNAEKSGKTLILLNPPYGKRLMPENIESFYRKIGNTMRLHYPKAGYAIICPGISYEKILSLSHDRKVLFMNGGIKVAVIIKNAPGL